LLTPTRRKFSAEEKIRIVLDGLRGEEFRSPSLCRREGIAESLYYNWSKEFLEAGKKPPGGRHRAGRDQRPRSRSAAREDCATLKEVVAEQTLWRTGCSKKA
jgi:transposase